MFEEFENLACQFVKATYVKQGLQNIRSSKHAIRILLESRKLPKHGLDDYTIESFMHDLALMDSNNFNGNCGVGEREGRVYSDMVRRRHYALAHGIGRSGDIAEVQPKAAGSSLLYSLTNLLVLHAFHLSGLTSMKKCLVVPLATGMTLTLTLLTLRKSNPQAKYVIWPRIDQKSCFKAILALGMTPLVVENRLDDSALMMTDVSEVERLLVQHVGEVLCVLSTTSCFAPRQPDQIDRIAKLCKAHSTAHVINNAYGIQCARISKLINRANTIGRVDAVIQSTDKNFMVPVGGAIVSSNLPSFIDAISGMYPGRASSSPIVDLFITLLSMGELRYKALLEERQARYALLLEGLQSIATRYGERIIPSQTNTISIAMTLDRLERSCEMQDRNKKMNPPETRSGEEVASSSPSASQISSGADLSNNASGEVGRSSGSSNRGKDSSHSGGQDVGTGGGKAVSSSTFLGSMLFQRNVSGCRVVSRNGKSSSIGGHVFKVWGSHIDDYQHTYMTAACALGMTDNDVRIFLERLDNTMRKCYKQVGCVDVTHNASAIGMQLSTDTVACTTQAADDDLHDGVKESEVKIGGLEAGFPNWSGFQVQSENEKAENDKVTVKANTSTESEGLLSDLKDLRNLLRRTPVQPAPSEPTGIQKGDGNGLDDGKVLSDTADRS